MSRRHVIVAALAGALAGCGHSSPQFSGAVPTGTPTPSAQAVFGQCAFCHDDIATQLLAGGGLHVFPTPTPGGSAADAGCVVCHQLPAGVSPSQVGPGHRAVPACTDCHTEETHHDPAAGTPQQCLLCHTPHGSPNLSLIRPQITTPAGVSQPVTFSNRDGLADGGFASLSDPGTGVCEICHGSCPGGACQAVTAGGSGTCAGGDRAGAACTAFYRSDGTSETEHFTFACYTCHPHAQAFFPRQTVTPVPTPTATPVSD